MVLVNLLLAKVPVNAAPRRVHDSGRARHPHRFQDVVREDGSGIEIDRRFDRCSCDVRVRCQVDDRVDSRHGGSKTVEVGDVPANDAQSAVPRMPIEMPLPSGSKIIENSYRFDGSFVQ